ncbi:MAG: hypothetical protein AAFZ65_11760 [Planctomycetota bacterium]
MLVEGAHHPGQGGFGQLVAVVHLAIEVPLEHHLHRGRDLLQLGGQGLALELVAQAVDLSIAQALGELELEVGLGQGGLGSGELRQAVELELEPPRDLVADRRQPEGREAAGLGVGRVEELEQDLARHASLGAAAVGVGCQRGVDPHHRRALGALGQVHQGLRQLLTLF